MQRSPERPGRRPLVSRIGWPLALAASALVAAAVAFQPHGSDPQVKLAASTVPTPSHVVVVMEENHSFSDIIGNTADAPYINSLASQGASMTSYYGITHPSDPNYLALYAGSTFGLTADECPLAEGNTANLGSELLGAGDTFVGYSEGLPSTGSQTCSSGEYASKHSPWVNFTNVPAADQQPFSAFPSSSNYASLPTLSFVIPNLDDDMHDGTIQEGDTWLQNNLSSYATWAKTHNSLLVVTWDEDDYTESNQVPAIIVGQGVTPGTYDETVNHYNLLATLEAMYGLGQVGGSAGLSPITDIWSGSSTGTANTVTVTNPGARTATVGTAASLQLGATDSASGQTLTYTASGLPAGLSISSGGLISGTPTTSGTDDVIVTATDTSGATGSAAFAYSVNPATGADTVTLTNPGSQTGTVGAAASVQITGTDSNSGQALAYTATDLPPGLSIGSASGLISGTPTTAGSYDVTVNADDTTGATAGTTFTYTVDAATATDLSGTSVLTVSGQALDDLNYSSSSGTQMVTRSVDGNSDEDWQLSQNSDGSYTLVNGSSGLCLDVKGSSTKAGAEIIQSTCTGSAAESWVFTPAAGGGYTVAAEVSGLPMTTASTAKHSPVTQQAASTSALQTWTLQ